MAFISRLSHFLICAKLSEQNITYEAFRGEIFSILNEFYSINAFPLWLSLPSPFLCLYEFQFIFPLAWHFNGLVTRVRQEFKFMVHPFVLAFMAKSFSGWHFKSKIPCWYDFLLILYFFVKSCVAYFSLVLFKIVTRMGMEFYLTVHPCIFRYITNKFEERNFLSVMNK